MKVYLIHPPAPYLLDERGQIPLGITYLHAFLEKNGVDVVFVDLAGLKECEWDIPTDGDIYGITACTPQYPAALHIAEVVKNGGNWVVLGGIHATALPERSLCEGKFDAVVCGEGEHGLMDFINNPREGIIRPELEPNIDVFPHPNLDAVDEESYRCFAFHDPEIADQPRGIHLITSRGCYAKCAFCSSPFFWKRRVRYHSDEYMDGYLGYLRHRGYNHLYLLDETFVISRKRTRRICALLKKYGMLWRTSSRADTLDSDILKIMRDSGCRQIDIGVESGSQRILNLLNKGETVKDISKAVKEAHKLGMDVKASLMVGLPTETQEDVNLTVKFIKEHPEIGSVSLATFQPVPGCDIFFHPEKYHYEYAEPSSWEDLWIAGGSEAPVTTRTKEDGEKVEKYRQQIIDVAGDRYTRKRMAKRVASWGK